MDLRVRVKSFPACAHLQVAPVLGADMRTPRIGGFHVGAHAAPHQGRLEQRDDCTEAAQLTLEFLQIQNSSEFKLLNQVIWCQWLGHAIWRGIRVLK